MKRILLAMALTLVAVPAFAQHPCDVVPTSKVNYFVNDPIVLGECTTGTDTNGNPAGITEITYYREGVSVLVVQPSAFGTPSATGERYTESTFKETNAGQVNYAVSFRNAQGETAHIPFPALSLSLAPSIPSAPIKLRSK